MVCAGEPSAPHLLGPLEANVEFALGLLVVVGLWSHAVKDTGSKDHGLYLACLLGVHSSNSGRAPALAGLLLVWLGSPL